MQNPLENNKHCQRCQQNFTCNPADIVACGCIGVQMSPEELKYVASFYSDCVCNACLLHLKNEFLSK